MGKYIRNLDLIEHYTKSIFLNQITDELKKYLIYIVEAYHRKLYWMDEERRKYTFDNTVKDILNNWKSFDNIDPIFTYYAKEAKKLTFTYYTQYPNIRRTELIDKMLYDN